MRKLLFTLLLLGIGWKIISGPASVSYSPGVLVAELPQQAPLSAPATFQIDDYRITPLASFALKARVLARKDYTFGREADLSPVDLALGWGRMSDEAVLEQLTISQGGRWYRWRAERFPIPRREIETHSANMHLIPADSAIAAQIEQARQGEIVQLSGYLVKVDAGDGWHWQSSLTREDTGSHACELIWVEQFQIVGL